MPGGRALAAWPRSGHCQISGWLDLDLQTTAVQLYSLYCSAKEMGKCYTAMTALVTVQVVTLYTPALYDCTRLHTAVNIQRSGIAVLPSQPTSSPPTCIQ